MCFDSFQENKKFKFLCQSKSPAFVDGVYEVEILSNSPAEGLNVLLNVDTT